MDWQAGDLALCCRDGIAPFEPQRGRIYRVQAVHTDDDGSVGLEIAEVPNDEGYDGWDATGFIKITPEEADEYDQEIIDLMNSQPVPAEGV